MPNTSTSSRRTLAVGARRYEIASLRADGGDITRLPYTIRVLLENLLRHEDGVTVTRDDVEAVRRYDGSKVPRLEVAFRPARVLLQDFTGVPALVDLAALRDALAELGSDPARANPLVPVELVIDHSLQVDSYGTKDAAQRNADVQFDKNHERFAFLRWGQQAFRNFVVAPPNAGIVHQINLEHLARVVFTSEDNPAEQTNGVVRAYPDTVIGTDSHTPMVNGLGVLGWGVGGIEAEAAMLGQPLSMLLPEVIGIRLHGELPPGATATDLVLTITELLRKRGVVGKFVEFFGAGVSRVALADRATIGNMSPEYGATCAVFPVDDVTLEYMRLTGRSKERIALVEAYAKEQGLFHDPTREETPAYSDVLTLDLGSVEPCIAGPKRPQDRVPLRDAKRAFLESIDTFGGRKSCPTTKDHTLSLAPANVGVWGEETGGRPITAPSSFAAQPAAMQQAMTDGAIVIASITSCTNTSNPSVMLAAGLLAKKAVERGLVPAPWVKTSLAPGSRVVSDYLIDAGLMPYLEKLGFHVVGYGCATCIGNSGPLPPAVATAIDELDLVACAVLSGNRNFEGRIHSLVRANYLMSPPLVVAYAIAGRIDVDLTTEPLGMGKDGPVFLRDLWPTADEIRAEVQAHVRSEMFRNRYAHIFEGDARWESLEVASGSRYQWDETSTYVRKPPYFEDVGPDVDAGFVDVQGARVLALLGDSVTTDHISPAGSIRATSPAGRFLVERGVEPKEFNSYGARRGNHEVMVRGTFANVRIRNRMVPNVEGGVTKHLPSGEVLSIYDAAMRYRDENVPLVIVAGKEYGSGSSRDWAAKGTVLLGVRAVLAESFERIHRSNLVGMGVVPLQFLPGESAATHGISGQETFDVVGLAEGVASSFEHGREVRVVVHREDGTQFDLRATVRIDTPQEVLQFRHGGILPFVLRRLLGAVEAPQPLAVATRPAPVAAADGAVEEGSIESFPASDSPAY